MRTDGLSSVSTLCLAILYRGERTGYEIKRESVDGEWHYFAEASYGAIYPALARLAAEGYVTVREEVQSGRPSRKVYAITPKGAKALLGVLCEPPGADLYQSKFLLVASFARELPAGVIAEALETRRAELTRELALIRARMGNYDDGDAADWISHYAINCLEASLRYIEHEGERLIRLAVADVANAAE